MGIYVGKTSLGRFWQGIKTRLAGKMDKSVYDANSDGVVDNAAKVNNHTVASDVPANAKFTDTKYTANTTSIGSASAGTAIAADDITAWTTNTPTSVTKKTVVTGGSTTDIPNVTQTKTVLISLTGGAASYSNGILTLTDVIPSYGPSITLGTAIKAYTSLSTGDSVDVTPGTAASLSYTSRSIPNISVTSKTVATGISES